MKSALFERFKPVISSLSAAELNGAPSLFERLTMATDGRVQVCYAPFEYVNPQARVVLVGITPGKTQMLNALHEARRQLNQGSDAAATLKAAKGVGAFSGSMRPNLISMLDTLGMHKLLNIPTSAELFSTAAHMVQTTSVLRNPVFVRGENYNGVPNMLKHPLLLEQLTTHFVEDVAALPNAVFIPMGEKVTEALMYLANKGLIDPNRILDGMPHPSGANAERIAYFTGRKAKDTLSVKTDPVKLDEARKRLQDRIAALAGKV